MRRTSWLEITNLLIHQANDSQEELKEMCSWLVEALGPDVPVHFSAFHPDFRLRDRGPTPPETLALAHDIARRAGLRYAYTGNISDRRRQTTYCPGCGKVLIERDGYHLGVYAMNGDRCRHCGAAVAGRFDARPGDWGGRRMPVRISGYAKPKAQPAAGSPSGPARLLGLTDNAQPPVQRQGDRIMPDQPQPAATAVSVSSGKPQLTKPQEERVLQAACRRVIAAVTGGPPEHLEQVLEEIAAVPLLGAFVTLKRTGQLRSCCGYLGQSVPLAQAIDHAAFRAATDDPRFPPISPVELPELDVDAGCSGAWSRSPGRAAERREVVVIGKHGLQIARGHARGLLLPGVAVEHHLDAEGSWSRSAARPVCRRTPGRRTTRC